MELIYRKHAYPFRSRGLFLFLRILKDAYPGWVDLASIGTRLPGIDPRQLARFVDLLEAAKLPLVRYETKTRGRFRLAVKPESIDFSGDQEPPGTPPVIPLISTPAAVTSLAVYQDEAWVAWVIALVHSTLALNDGHLSGKNGALVLLDMAEAATGTLPLWTASVVHVMRAFVLERKSRYREAACWLRRVDTSVRQGIAHPAAKAGAQLVRAKMRYDQGRYAEAERLLGLPSEPGISHCPHWLNMNALVAGRKFLSAGEFEASMLLTQTLSLLAEGLGHVFLWRGNTNLLDGICYNFGNNLLRGIKRGLIPEACADTAMQWLAADMLICRKLGIGDDSILTNLLLVDVCLDYGHSVKQWPHLLRCEMKVSGDLAGVLGKALAQARQTGNRLEIAQCLRRQMLLATSPDEARQVYLEAVELSGYQGKKDLVQVLAEEWRTRFGSSPPKLRREHGT
jgi:hypothetical protein